MSEVISHRESHVDFSWLSEKRAKILLVLGIFLVGGVVAGVKSDIFLSDDPKWNDLSEIQKSARERCAVMPQFKYFLIKDDGTVMFSQEELSANMKNVFPCSEKEN